MSIMSMSLISMLNLALQMMTPSQVAYDELWAAVPDGAFTSPPPLILSF